MLASKFPTKNASIAQCYMCTKWMKHHPKTKETSMTNQTTFNFECLFLLFFNLSRMVSTNL